MNFKTVAGLGRAEYVSRAVNVAMEKGLEPHYVQEWVNWFNKQEPDNEGLTVAPEFHVSDLDEVAHAVLRRIEHDFVEVNKRVAGTPTLSYPVSDIFTKVAQELATPGYVESLLP
ncbi:TPA: hypothetical protein OMT00_001638 [Klebsiella aerogenes]|nr:hypothetical protein [Klebsiella aerogenes]